MTLDSWSGAFEFGLFAQTDSWTAWLDPVRWIMYVWHLASFWVTALARWGWSWMWDNPIAFLFAGYAFLRAWGTLIKTGWQGIRFTWGRPVGILEPGFHFVIPLVQQIKAIRVRSITLDLPRQRIVTADDLAYDIEISIVYRIHDPQKAIIEIDSVHTGVEALTLISVQEVLRDVPSTALRDRDTLDDRLIAHIAPRLARWGVVIEHFGFNTIAPSPTTARVTQLRTRIAERRQVLRELLRDGLCETAALTFLGSERRLVAHATDVRARLKRDDRRYEHAETMRRAATEAPKVDGTSKQPTTEKTKDVDGQGDLGDAWQEIKKAMSDNGPSTPIVRPRVLRGSLRDPFRFFEQRPLPPVAPKKEETG